eukprot:CAMPEP_0181064846 /NCGR_PEP_ID=MMETSP1070-20121207/24413_1 /TAXON_ID=265543 /ORGANISM="Minutocellus polymorphus, Strain NH13" /LENGTH=80 /DNA_ID=CAMNT_0023145177 /DNA_START=160 /DNA_END=402 /DNA_ORIENTATION=-
MPASPTTSSDTAWLMKISEPLPPWSSSGGTRKDSCCSANIFSAGDSRWPLLPPIPALEPELLPRPRLRLDERLLGLDGGD